MSILLNRVVTDGIEMQYLKFGKGSETLVILPGLSVQSVLSAAAAIETQYALFCDDYTIYLFDRRSNLPPVYTVPDMARDTVRAMKALGLSDVCLFGASQGGMMAAVIAAEQPSLVRKLALGSALCRVNGACGAVLAQWVAAARKGDAQRLCFSFGETVYPDAVFQQNRDAFAAMAKGVTAGDLRRFVILAEGMEGFDMTDMCTRIRCPVLALFDGEDRVFGAAAATELAAQFEDHPAFEMVMYHGYGHAAYDTAPDYTQRLFCFFAGKAGTE